MKRITVWVDCEDGSVEDTKRKIQACLREEKLEFTFLPPSDIFYASKKAK